jgi:hypothetical protein
MQVPHQTLETPELQQLAWCCLTAQPAVLLLVASALRQVVEVLRRVVTNVPPL